MNGSNKAPDVSRVVCALLDGALKGVELETLFESLCDDLRADGMGIGRAHMAVNTLHPQFSGFSHTWYHNAEMNTQYYGYSTGDDWLASPLYYMISNRVVEVRRRLTGPGTVRDFPVLENFAAQGFTDYRGFLTPFGWGETLDRDDEGVAGSWCSTLPEGFDDQQLAALREVELALGVVAKMHMQIDMTENILNAYLGPDAGRQVRRGRIRRGDVESVEAVIWYSDMRGSTDLAATRAGEDFLADVNEYFECTAGAIIESGGEVLRFIGDAVLGIFPVRTDNELESAFRNAESALVLAQRKMEETNTGRVAGGQQKLRYGVALYYGELLYGNIGAPDRLEFSVVGTVANEVARLEEMTKHLGFTAVVSGAVANQLTLELDDLGDHDIRGSDVSLRVFGVRSHGKQES